LFLANEASAIASIDFFTVPTATFRVLYVFVVLIHERRRVVHFNVTENPTARWTAQQIVEAFPWDSAPKHLIRDNDTIFGPGFSARVTGMNIKDVQYGVSVSLAESILRKSDRLNPSRLPGSCDYFQRSSSAPNP
jgi:hypothetical protein